MFKYLLLRIRVAKVQAELMAQIHNQAVVNRLCQKPESIELIDFLYRNAYYRKRKDVNFLIVCLVMMKLIKMDTINPIERDLCYIILKERYDKMSKDRVYCSQNFGIVDEIAETLMLWELEKH